MICPSIDVLDQFSASSTAPPASAIKDAKIHAQPTPSASGPGRPDGDTSKSHTTPTSFSATQPRSSAAPNTDPSEEEFMAHLSAEMSALIGNMSHDPAASMKTPDQFAQMGKELEQFTERMEKEGVKPEDLLKAILGEGDAEKVLDKAADVRKQSEIEGVSEGSSRPKNVAAATESSPGRDGKPATAAAANTTFEDTIRRTMERMSTSDATATNAATQSANSEEDMLAQLLKAMETEGRGGADGDDGELSKMFLGMMEQLTNKDMLYEPMKELDEKFPEWLAKKEKEGKLPAEDMTRYRNQRGIVREIVGKFEEKGYSDEDPRCREFIWERMQRMQNEGSPPEDLIANPFPGMGGVPGLGAGEGGEDVGCPTQ
jgi:peroxin-19